MKKLTLKIEDKTYKAILPEKWEEVTTEQFLKLKGFEGGTYTSGIEVLHRLTDIDLLALLNSKPSAKTEQALNVALELFLSPLPDIDKRVRAKTIKVNDTEVKVPTDIERLSTFGQVIHIKGLMQDEERDVDERVAECCSVFLQPLVDNDRFNPDRVAEMVSVVNQMPIVQTAPLASFFFRKLVEYPIYGKPIYHG